MSASGTGEGAVPFIKRWQRSEAAEWANYGLFLIELCEMLGVPRRSRLGDEEHRNSYVFEKAVKFQNLDRTVSHGRIDLYWRERFVLEAKQGEHCALSTTRVENSR